MTIDLSSQVEIGDEFLFRAIINNEDWKSELFLFNKFYQRMSAEGVRTDQGALKLSLIPDDIFKVAFVIYTESLNPKPITADCQILDPISQLKLFDFHINQTQDKCDSVVVYELVRSSGGWILRGVGFNVWGGLRTIYKAIGARA